MCTCGLVSIEYSVSLSVESTTLILCSTPHMHAAALGRQALKRYCMRICDVKVSTTLTVWLKCSCSSSASYRQTVELWGCSPVISIQSVARQSSNWVSFTILYDPFLLMVMLTSYLLHIGPFFSPFFTMLALCRTCNWGRTNCCLNLLSIFHW